jgi:hypothetical protein
MDSVIRSLFPTEVDFRERAAAGFGNKQRGISKVGYGACVTALDVR